MKIYIEPLPDAAQHVILWASTDDLVKLRDLLDAAITDNARSQFSGDTFGPSLEIAIHHETPLAANLGRAYRKPERPS